MILLLTLIAALIGGAIKLFYHPKAKSPDRKG